MEAQTGNWWANTASIGTLAAVSPQCSFRNVAHF